MYTYRNSTLRPPWHDIFPYSIVGAINSHTVRLPPHVSGHQQYCGRRHLPYQANMLKSLACLQISIVWQAVTSTIPKEDNTTSHVHLTYNSIMAAYHHLVPAGVGNKA